MDEKAHLAELMAEKMCITKLALADGVKPPFDERDADRAWVLTALLRLLPTEVVWIGAFLRFVEKETVTDEKCVLFPARVMALEELVQSGKVILSHGGIDGDHRFVSKEELDEAYVKIYGFSKLNEDKLEALTKESDKRYEEA